MKESLKRRYSEQMIEDDLQRGLLKHTKLKQLLDEYADIQLVPNNQDSPILSFYCEGMIDTVQLNEITSI